MVGAKSFYSRVKQQNVDAALRRVVDHTVNPLVVISKRVRGPASKLCDTPWIYCFDESSDKQRDLAVRDHLQKERQREQRLVCRRCLSWVTSGAERICMSGSHAHAFTNPLGISFDIGCFGDAPGCSTHGVETHEHTWFAGYSWRMAVCAHCGNHLGWLYYGSDKQFYGLILSQLVEATDDG